MNLKVDHISAGYGKKKVISGISFEVQAGKICGLMGRNGSGKTTLLRCLNRVLPVGHGRVTIMGKDISSLGRRKIAKMVSTVPQGSYSPFSFSCMDMVLMAGVSGMGAWEKPSAAQKKAALRMMAEVGVEHLAKDPFNWISGGERQLVMLARGLFQDTPIMLLDEPTSHLDFTNQHRVMSLIQTLVKQRRMSAVISLHDPNLARYYCDEVIMVKNGCMAASGPVKDVMTGPVLSEVLGSPVDCGRTLNGIFVATPAHLNAKVL